MLVLHMKLDQRSEPETQAILIRFGKCLPQHTIEQEAGFEVGSRRSVLNEPDAVAQVELLGPFLDWTEQSLQSSPQICGLADVRIGLRILAPQQEHGRRRRHCGKDIEIPFRRRSEEHTSEL